MKYFGFLIVVLCVDYTRTENVPRECAGINPMKLEEVKSLIDGKYYWTKIFIGEPQSDYPLPNQKIQLTYSKYQFSDDNRSIEIINHYNSRKYDSKDDKYILADTLHFLVGKRKAIFKTYEARKSVAQKITLIREPELQVTYSQDERVPLLNGLTFAAIYADDHGDFIIFQRCNTEKLEVWVQIEAEVVKNYFTLGNKSATSCVYSLKIYSTLTELKILSPHEEHEVVVDIVGNNLRVSPHDIKCYTQNHFSEP